MLVHVSGFNLGLMMRRLLGVGTPRGLQGRLGAVIMLLLAVRSIMRTALSYRPWPSPDFDDPTAAFETQSSYAVAQ